MKPLLLAVIVMVCAISRAADLKACDYPQGIYSGFPWFGYGYSGSLYGLGYVPVPPYYALHPPVYYSHPVSRPYGDSPFAAYPRPSSTSDSPRLIVNPFASSANKADAKSPSGDDTPTPSPIVNPFYKPK